MFLDQNSSFIHSLEKKLLSKTLYTKYFIRHTFVGRHHANNVSVIDNNSQLYTINLNIKYFQKTFFKRKNAKIGFSLCLDNFIYTNSNPQFQFKFYLLTSSLSNSTYINFLFTKLKIIQSSKKILLLVNPKHGGISCFFNGICGFFPRKHVFYLYQKSLLKTKFSQLIVSNKEQNRKFSSLAKSFLSNLFIKIKYSFNKEIKISVLKYLQLQLLYGNFTIKMIFNLVLFNYKKLLAFSKKRYQIKLLNHLNLLLPNKNHLLPKTLTSFIYYRLSIQSKKRYYNSKIKRKTKKWKKRLFKTRIKILFLAYIRKKKLKPNKLRVH